MKNRIILITLLVLGMVVFAEGKQDENQGFYDNGMMGSGFNGHGNGSGYGMMGNGMMGGYSNYPEDGERMDMESVEEHVNNYLSDYSDKELSIAEIMEFHQNFYVQVADADSDFLIQELIVNPYSGEIYPEQGPNMMWNLSTPHMMNTFSRRQPRNMTVDEDEAIELAAEYLESTLPGAKPEEHADKFNGYYTIHVINDNNIVGMLSVNGYSGQVWYHNWHGEFLGMEDSH